MGLTELVGKGMDRDQDQLLLKGTGDSITESLTAKRMEHLNKAREEHGFTNVWTTDGRILFKRPNENKSNLL